MSYLFSTLYLQVEKFIIVDIDADGEVQSLVAFIHYLEVVELAHEKNT
jgi:hypothetical protein